MAMTVRIQGFFPVGRIQMGRRTPWVGLSGLQMANECESPAPVPKYVLLSLENIEHGI